MKIFGTDLGVSRADQAVALSCCCGAFVADLLLLGSISGTEAFAIGAAGGLAAKCSVEAVFFADDSTKRRFETLRAALEEANAADLLDELDRLQAVSASMSDQAVQTALDDIAARFAGKPGGGA